VLVLWSKGSLFKTQRSQYYDIKFCKQKNFTVSQTSKGARSYKLKCASQIGWWQRSLWEGREKKLLVSFGQEVSYVCPRGIGTDQIS
jgi:hypothetical protein